MKTYITQLLLLILLTAQNSLAQDSTFIGRFALGVNFGVGSSNTPEESRHSGYQAQLRYFPTPKLAFVMSQSGFFSDIQRAETSKAFKHSISFGGEKYFNLTKFNPYLGLEGGLSFVKVNSDLINNQENRYFLNSLALYLFKPKVGVQINITDNLHTRLEANYHWSFHSDGFVQNPLFDTSGNPMYFGRKVAFFSVGVGWLFNE